MSVDTSGLRGIDIHTHIPRPPHLAPSRRAAQMAQYFRSPVMGMSVEEMVELYRRLQMMAVVFDVDATSTDASPGVGNDYVAEVQQRYPDVLIGWASVDPWQGRAAIQELERAVTALGLRGLKLHPTMQGFDPADDRFLPFFDAAAELGLVVLTHAGTSGLGAGEPGGQGLRIDLARPLLLDRVAARHPQMPIVLAHVGWPWHLEALAMALHKSNVVLDISGWRYRYLPEDVRREMARRLRGQFCFGTDYPMFDPEACLDELSALGLPDEAERRVLRDNAAALLGLE